MSSGTANAYGQHWDRVYIGDSSQLSREWHCTYQRLQPLLEPYLRRAASCNACASTSQAPDASASSGAATRALPALVVDVGCGSSAMGMEVLQSDFGFNHLILLDASPTVLDKLRERSQHSQTAPTTTSPQPGSANKGTNTGINTPTTSNTNPTYSSTSNSTSTAYNSNSVCYGNGACDTNDNGNGHSTDKPHANSQLSNGPQDTPTDQSWPSHSSQSSSIGHTARMLNDLHVSMPAAASTPSDHTSSGTSNAHQPATAATTIVAPATSAAAPALVSAVTGTQEVALMLGDCRRLPLLNGCAAAVIDKGTMDALWHDHEKLAMLHECVRVMARPHGVLVSVSFSSNTRLQMLRREAAALDLQCRVHVVGDGDPARGHEVRFLSLLSPDFGSIPYQPDGLTLKILHRLEKSGSLMASDDESGPGGSGLAPLCDLFHDDDC